ncbi:hypothetical protein VTH06DRAFT_6411 [Thermothelomyces fergusii]
MDSVKIVVVESPSTNIAPLYEADPDADALLIVPPSNKIIALHKKLPSHLNGLDDEQHAREAVTSVLQTGLRIKVSSKHLALASRVFKNKLQFSNLRAARQSDGRVHLKLAEGFHPSAVSIVINAIHGRGSKVPKKIDLETLVQVAFFVDQFQLLDAVESGGHQQGQEHEATTTTVPSLIWPRPTRPFPGISFTAVVGRVDRGLGAYRWAVEVREEAERQRRQPVEVDPWYMMKKGGGPGTATPGRPGWGVVSERLPVTPAASPEPVYANPRPEPGGDGREQHPHQCAISSVVATLGELQRLGDEVEGLNLEGRLGYLQY